MVEMKPGGKVLVLSRKDNVGTAAVELERGESFFVEGDNRREVTARENIPFGFKVALVDIQEGGEILKYGEVIGRSTCPIRAGDMVHVHNIAGARGRGDLELVQKRYHRRAAEFAE